jgi:phosphoribosylformylglycinamidine cyclo-ligase
VPIDYKQAGVDVEAGYEAVKLMKRHIKTTFDENVLGDVGSFGGLYSIAGFNMREPVLVSGTDGVGTKLKLAFALDKHDTVGIDLVAMCANDIICQGAKPLFFLDYMATGKLLPEKAAQIVGGIADGCRQSGCALIGGETAEMPGFYSEGEYDLAGFCVGIVDKSEIIDGKSIKSGDVLVGLKSSGVHSNGFSLVRKLFGDDTEALAKKYEGLDKPIGETLLTPTKIYVEDIAKLYGNVKIKGMSHITGGGFIENIPRMLPNGLCAKIDVNSYEVPQIFKTMREISGLADSKMYNTFNMGIGMVLAVDAKNADKVVEILPDSVVIGEVIEGEGVLL